MGDTFQAKARPFRVYRWLSVTFSRFSIKNQGFTMNDFAAPRQEGNNRTDWHPADIQAALKKRGLSLSGLSVANGYHATAAGKALKQAWPALEALIAEAIELRPEQIWPSRYHCGQPVRSRKNYICK
jgi:Ner family transcriptional regulator